MSSISGKKEYIFNSSTNGKEIRAIRNTLGMTQREFADFLCVSKPTVERWESQNDSVTGPIVPLVELFKRDPDLVQRLKVPERIFPLRLWYYSGQSVSTIIDVNEVKRAVKIYNYTDDLILRAFGRNGEPTFEEYEEFLESRCFPRERDKMKLYLKELDIPFYDPLLIIEKTEGRMAEDDCWIRIER